MLSELYEYALRNQLVARPGFKLKKPKGYICLDCNGNFIGIDPAPETDVLCPDMGSAAQGTDKCNVLVEKAMISLTQEKPKKRSFFLQALADGAAREPRLDVLRTALTTPDCVERICCEMEEKKQKLADSMGYKVDGIPLESLPSVQAWWAEYYAKQHNGKGKAARSRCLITGELTIPLQTVPKVSGLRAVGGHSSGDALICFDKDAFQSYGQRQAENACVSEAAMAAVNAALGRLIAKAPVLAGAKWIHWYSKELATQDDDPFAGFISAGVAEEEEEEEADAAATLAQQKIAEAKASQLVKSMATGKTISLPDVEYYILSLSGAGGRMMVRGWQQGKYDDLENAIQQWQKDLSLVQQNGRAINDALPPLGKLNYRLLKPQTGAGKSVSERMEKELSGLEPRLVFAALNQQPLPDAVAAKALEYVRSHMMNSGKEDAAKRTQMPDGRACQLLKAWLVRKDRKQKGESNMQAELNAQYPGAAYQCGRMMAVYAAIQDRAMGKDLGAGVLQRYYAAASRTPALVLGRLSALCQHHLAKLDSPASVHYYEALLGEIAQKIGPTAPAVLDLRQQAEFTLGYYQQRAALFAPRNKNGADTEVEKQ